MKQEQVYDPSSISFKIRKELESLATQMELPKDHYLARQGSELKHVVFVMSGVIRSYCLIDGKEYTYRFCDEGGIIFPNHLKGCSKKTLTNVQVIQDASVYSLGVDQVDMLLKENDILKALFLKINEGSYLVD